MLYEVFLSYLHLGNLILISLKITDALNLEGNKDDDLT